MGIKLLNKDISEQIAAGEVIESPVSVVKELVENSLDAASTEIDIYIEDGGKSLISVTDNGAGIKADELSLALERYATSKISSFDDLLKLYSLGFRGEALPSIASISKVKIATRRKEDLSGSSLISSGGEILKQEETGTAPGTTIEVKNLFFNTPARLKFLRSNTVETAKISSLISEMALVHPQVAFKLKSGDRLLLQTRGDNKLLHVIDSVYGKDIRENMIEVKGTDSDRHFVISGYTSAPVLTRSARRWITIAINQRLVHDNQVIFQLIRAYGNTLPSKRYPVAVINIDIPPAMIDVNVHPAKTEIRFEEPELIKNFIYKTIKRSLVSDKNLPYWPGNEFSKSVTSKNTLVNENNFIQDEIRENYKTKAFSPEQRVTTSEHKDRYDDQLSDNAGSINLLGQFLSSYIVAQKDDELIIIDQHAAHERLLYYELEEEVRKKSRLLKQQLTMPLVINLPPRWTEGLTELMPLLKKHGFDLEPLSDTSYAVRAIPALFYENNDSSLVYSFLEDLFEDSIESIKAVEDKILKTIACHRSIKAKQPLTRVEMEHLINKWNKVTGFQYCPHGRPIVISLKKDDLDRQFKRRE